MQIWQKKIDIFQIQDGGRTPYWKSFYWLYLDAILADQREIWNRDERSHVDRGHVTKTAIFPNSRWRTAAMLIIAFISIYQPWIIRFRSNLVHRCKFPFRESKFDKNRTFNSRWRRDAKLKIVFGYISVPYWPINAKFGLEMTNHMQI